MKRIHRLAFCMLVFAAFDKLAQIYFSLPPMNGMQLGILSAIVAWALEDK